MVTSAPAVPAALQVELDLFRGPLHTLLDLIERHELPIARVSLVEVTDGYLALVRGAPMLDLDTTAEFLHIASRLLLLKSQALLPQSSDAEPDDEGETEGDLEARLLTYRRYRDAATRLAARQEAGLRLFGRRAMTPPAGASPLARFQHVTEGTATASRATAGATLPPARVDPRRLLKAARRAVDRVVARERAVAAAPAPLIAFAQVLQRVVERLRGQRRTHLHDVVAEAPDVITAITMFLAVLELVRRRQLLLHQHRTFGPIELISIGAESDGSDRVEGE